MIFFPVEAIKKSGIKKIAIVTNKDFDKEVRQTFAGDKNISFAIQKMQLGTADAVKAARTAVDKSCEYIFIMPGDVPLAKPDTIKNFVSKAIAEGVVCSLLTMKPCDPANYGRIVRDSCDNVKSIVEAKDATEEELSIDEVNSGVYLVKKDWLFGAMKKIISTNAQKEFYLTDIVKIAVDAGEKVTASCVDDEDELMGINTRMELSEAAMIMRFQILEALMLTGVGIQDPLHTYIDCGTKIGRDTTIAPHCFISGKTSIGQGCVIDNGVVIVDSNIGDNVHIKPYSVLESSVVKNSSVVGPFARLRPGAVLDSNVKVGNFVEIKKSRLKKGSKANHLSYIGDATVGSGTNVGCGTITCNYDGKKKHKTIIGDNVFVGSDVQFVAPVKVGSGSTIGAGSTITGNVPTNSLAIARGHQVVKKNWKG